MPLVLESLEDRRLMSVMTDLLFPPENGVPYTWQNQVPGSGGINIYFDFRSRDGVANQITPAEQAVAIDAMNMWSNATNGRLHFFRNTTAPDSQIINIGKGNLRAVGDISVRGGVVGEGGVDNAFADGNGNNVLHQGFAWLDVAENWNLTPGTSPRGTTNFFVVAAHEIGHALGLGHNDDLPGPSIMNSTVNDFLIGPSASDLAEVQFLYPPGAGVPNVDSNALLVVGADAGGGPQIRVFAGNTLRFTFNAYDAGFTGGVRVTVGDVTGDGVPEIVTAPGPGGGPDIHVYDSNTGQLIRQFFAYDPAFNGGVYTAIGDTNGDAYGDIICGADRGGGPNITIFSGKDGSRLNSFFAYNPLFAGGVRVAAGDVDGDGRGEIIVGAGAGAGPNIAVYRVDGSLVRSFFAYDVRFNLGIYVSAGDVNEDGRADIVAGAGAGGGPNVTVFDGGSGAMLANFNAFESSSSSGVRVAAVNAFGKGRDVIYAVPGVGGTPSVRNFTLTGDQIDQFFAFDSLFRGGVFIGGNR